MTDHAVNNHEIIKEIGLITCVPLQGERLRKRGFNQSRVLAKQIAGFFEVPFKDTLEKLKTTRPQNELSREERLHNLSGAFEAGKDLSLSGLKILLIDDVLTTGATLDECSRVLKSADAKEIICFTLARGV